MFFCLVVYKRQIAEASRVAEHKSAERMREGEREQSNSFIDFSLPFLLSVLPSTPTHTHTHRKGRGKRRRGCGGKKKKDLRCRVFFPFLKLPRDPFLFALFFFPFRFAFSSSSKVSFSPRKINAMGFTCVVLFSNFFVSSFFVSWFFYYSRSSIKDVGRATNYYKRKLLPLWLRIY